jgi:thiol-disulfide isomerase/thioredoxin
MAIEFFLPRESLMMRRMFPLWRLLAALSLAIAGCDMANHSASVIGTAVGNTAPEMDGFDADEKPLKLSDYRGKVVLLDFWATWCGPCRSMFPHERELVSRLKDKPFVLLGVNGDNSRKDILRVQDAGDVTWRSWWDGELLKGQKHNITTIWNINGWPTLYLLDHKGVVRYISIGVPNDMNAFEKRINQLVEEAERDKQPAS